MQSETYCDGWFYRKAENRKVEWSAAEPRNDARKASGIRAPWFMVESGLHIYIGGTERASPSFI